MGGSRRSRVVSATLGIVVALASACGSGTPLPATPLAGCPVTEAEVEAAIGQGVDLPDVGGPYKVVTQQCSFGIGPFSLGQIQVLVYDAEGEGTGALDMVRTDFPEGVAIAGLGDAAFATATPAAKDLYVVTGEQVLHISVYRHDALPLEQLVAVARAALERL